MVAFFLGFEKAAKLREDTSLQPHQERVRKKLETTPGLLLYHGLGSGKTLSAIASTQGMGTDVVVPASLRENFTKEVTKHTDDYDPRIMSYEKFTKEKPSSEALIVDEAHLMGDAATKRQRALALQAKKYQRRLLLTGTPIKNKPHQLGAIMSVVRGDQEIPSEQKEFEQQYIGTRQVSPGFWGKLRGITPGEEQYLKDPQKLEQLTRGYVDYQESASEHFPSSTERTIDVPMSKEQERHYHYLEGKLDPILRWKVEHGLPPDKKESKSLNTFLQGLRQISNTVKPFGGKEEVSPKFQTALNSMKSKMKKDPNFRAMVYSNYLKAGVKEYSTQLSKAGIPHSVFTGEMRDKEKKKAVEDYNSGKIKAILLSGAGAQGLDLKGTKLIQILEPHWNNPRIEQAIGRGIRYKSHDHLPESERHVEVEKYRSTLPRSLWRKITRQKEPTSTDVYLDVLSKKKDELNKQFLDVLKKVGS